MNNQRPFAIQNQIFNKWFIASLVFCVIATLLLIISWIVSSRVGTGTGMAAIGNAMAGISGAILFMWVSIPFWILSVGCAICGQLERLINNQSQPAHQFSTPHQQIPMQAIQPQMQPIQQMQPAQTPIAGGQKFCILCAEPIPHDATTCPMCGSQQ